MKILGILAQKGGVGKTTLVLHWAVEAAARGEAVAVIDLDPQGSASWWKTQRKKETPHVFRATPANLEAVLKECSSAGYTVAFIDTAARLEAPSELAARLVDLVVIPSGPTPLDIVSVGTTINIARSKGSKTVIVVNHGRAGSRINADSAELLGKYGPSVCPTVVMKRAALADAFIDGRAVTELDPNGKGAQEIRDSWAWLLTQLGESDNAQTK